MNYHRILLPTLVAGLLSGLASAKANPTAPPIKPASPTSNTVAPKPKAAIRKAPAEKPSLPAKNKKETAKSPKKHNFSRSGICRNMDKLAKKYSLPPLFFAKLIWNESRFNPNAVSPKGAQGIAQFMPATAAERGLADPFNPVEALVHSADFLAELRRQLGSLGLAAAGYNAGPGRVRAWMNGTASLPLETRNYVYSITNQSAEAWADGKARFDAKNMVRGTLPAKACAQLSAALKRPIRRRYVTITDPKTGKRRKVLRKRKRYAPPPPWGVQVAGGFSRAKALSAYSRVRRKHARILGKKKMWVLRARKNARGRRPLHQVRIGAKTRRQATLLCNQLRAAGGACMVMQN